MLISAGVFKYGSLLKSTVIHLRPNIPPEHHIVERDAQIRVGLQNLRHLDFDLYFLIIGPSHTLENNHLQIGGK